MRSFFYKGRYFFIPLAAAAFLSAISFIVMQLWNHLLPAILHTGVITFWQAMGLFILCKILFGFGKGGPRGFKRRGPWMRQRMQERLKNMSPEEREKFKRKMNERMCHWREWDHNAGHDAEWDDMPSGTDR